MLEQQSRKKRDLHADGPPDTVLLSNVHVTLLVYLERYTELKGAMEVSKDKEAEWKSF